MNKRSIDAVSWGCNRLDAFGIGAGQNGHVYHKYWDGPDDDGSATNWQSLGGNARSAPTAISTKYGHLDVFYVDADKSVYVKHLANDTWSEWVSLKGGLYSNVEAASWGPDHVDIFALGGSKGETPYRKTMDKGVWANSWENLGGALQSDIAAVSWGPGRIDIFGNGGENIYTRSYDNGGWLSAWTSLGGTYKSPPTAVTRGYGTLDIFAVDTKGAVQHRSYANGKWAAWQSLQGILTTRVAAQTSSFFGTTRIDVFALGAGGSSDQVYRNTYNGATNKWEGWLAHGRSFDSAPAVASRQSNRLDIFCLEKDSSAMWHQAWNGTSWVPTLKTWANEKGVFKKFL